PRVEAQLWQLGISYYYAGQFEKGRALFEKHQTVNPQDVENAIWHFLCVARIKDMEAARKNFIPITSDSRVPMKELHGLFAGILKEQEVLAAVRVGQPSKAEEQNRRFYAYLYLALYDEAMGRNAESLAKMKKAVNELTDEHYMGDVARVHLKLRAGETKNSVKPTLPR
ncbi:MAG TPA: tetratricopeptide repeat protein, partial [Verrucomicrobiae bacterium]|nr:tetratricopeptide repeat protein [Verrucomicrobiae bacterium]